MKVKLWLRTTRTPPCARGPLLLKNLSDGPWENLKYLASDESWLDDPRNGERLLALMDTKELYGEEERESMLAACARLTFHLKRQKAESAKGFMTRWDTAERKVRDHGVQLPNEYLGFLMVHALQLSSDQIKLMLNYTKGSLKLHDLKAWLRVHETDLDLSNLGVDKKKVAVNYLFDDEQGESEVHHIQDPDAVEPEDEDFEVLLAAVNDLEGEDSETKVEISEAEAKEILMAMVKGKPRPAGRSFHKGHESQEKQGFGSWIRCRQERIHPSWHL